MLNYLVRSVLQVWLRTAENYCLFVSKTSLSLLLLCHWISRTCYTPCRCDALLKNWYGHQITEPGSILRWLIGTSDRGLMRYFDENERLKCFKLIVTKSKNFMSVSAYYRHWLVFCYDQDNTKCVRRRCYISSTITTSHANESPYRFVDKQAVIKAQMQDGSLINRLIYSSTPITRSSTFASEFLWFLILADLRLCVCGHTPPFIIIDPTSA
jgi:hypothetical protein